MINPRQFIRMAKWSRNPPSEKQVKLVIVVIIVCLLLFGWERLFGWPAWLTMNEMPRGRLRP